MSFIFIAPFFFSLYYLLKNRQDLAFLNVYLPCAILLPAYYGVRIPHLPPEPAATWALLPLAISLLFYPIPRLELRRLDLWVTLYLMSYAASELLRENSPKDGAAVFGAFFSQAFLAYVVGRRLIEPNLRMATVQRLVVLIVCLTPFVLYEYRMAQNPWIMLGEQLHIDTGFVQIRNGHARIQASFGHAILAGTVFTIVFLFNSSLADIYKRDKARLGPFIARLERYHIPALLLIALILLTRSRGPMISAIVGYAILQIPKYRDLKVAAAVIIIILLVAGGATYSYFNRYTSGADDGSMSEAQTSAIYRRELLTNYAPVLEKGGWLGWGALSFPRMNGQTSIDNHYLLIQLSQGKLGLYLFILIEVEAFLTVTFWAFTFNSYESRLFAFILLGALTAVYLSLITVYLGGEVAPLYFLLLGWSQSIRDNAKSPPKFHFRRLFS